MKYEFSIIFEPLPSPPEYHPSGQADGLQRRRPERADDLLERHAGILSLKEGDGKTIASCVRDEVWLG